MFVIRTHGAWQILGDENDDGEKSEDGQVLDQFNELTRSVGSILSGMHNYFLPTRFYSRRYPYLGYKGAMVSSLFVWIRTLRYLALILITTIAYN